MNTILLLMNELIYHWFHLILYLKLFPCHQGRPIISSGNKRMKTNQSLWIFVHTFMYVCVCKFTYLGTKFLTSGHWSHLLHFERFIFI